MDIPETGELDIKPLLADSQRALALDARVVLQPTAQSRADRLEIRPYPKELEETISLPSGRKVLLRPIRPEDEPAHYEMFKHFTPEDIHFRFFGMVRQYPHSEMARFTQIDYDREMAFIATETSASGVSQTLGVVRAIADPDNNTAEFAIIVRAELKGQGLGQALLEKIIRYCRHRGIQELVGELLADNQPMLKLAEKVGFKRKHTNDLSVISVTLLL